MDNKKNHSIEEEAPTNSVGSGNIAGMGVGPNGTPGVTPKKAKIYKKKNKQEADALEQQVLKKLSVKEGVFAGHKTFLVPEHVFNEARLAKRKGAHWTKYLNEDEYGKVIREYANKNTKSPIILQCEKTGYLCYARYGSK